MGRGPGRPKKSEQRKVRPTEEEILAFDNVPVELAAKYLDWGVHTLYEALQDQRAPFGVAAKRNAHWSYHISPGLLVRYQRGELPAYRMKELEGILVETVETILEHKLEGVNRAIGMVIGA